LAVCHSIIVDPRTSAYNSSSPDELALVNGAKDLGFEFLNRDSKKIISVKTPNGIKKFELLNVLEFTSARKRMSVVVRDL
jgi:magnesium-transporting ATPase (P-type)